MADLWEGRRHLVALALDGPPQALECGNADGEGSHAPSSALVEVHKRELGNLTHLAQLFILVGAHLPSWRIDS
jgi:hypothetical protein